jgi:uncharacterized phage protein gp47/JayE
MAKTETKTVTTTTAEFTESQTAAIHSVVADYLTNDEFDISLPHSSVVEAVQEVLLDKEVLKKVAAIVMAQAK